MAAKLKIFSFECILNCDSFKIYRQSKLGIFLSKPIVKAMSGIQTIGYTKMRHRTKISVTTFLILQMNGHDYLTKK